MCGIVAVFGCIGVNHEKAFKDMLIFDQVRGEHSTGVAFTSKSDDEPTVVKVVGTPDNLFDMNSFTKAMAGSHRSLIGHNRYATQGKVNRENAHPFSCGAITGVHNGTLRNYTELDGHGQFAVDSHVLYNHISRHGLADALSKCYGAMALVWWDSSNGTFNFYRNEERPLHYATTKDGNTGFLASEPWMILVSAGRRNVEISDIKEVPTDHLITFTLPKNTYTGKLPKPTMVYMKMREAPTYTGYYGTSGKSYTAPVSNTLSHLPVGVVVTSTGSNVVLHNQEYMHFYEEAEPSRDFVIHVNNQACAKIKMGDSFRINAAGMIRDKQNVYYSIRTDGMEQVGTNWEYTCEKVIGKAASNDEEEQSNDVPFLDSKGKDIGEQAWYRMYGSCSYCNGDVSHDAPFKFNTSGGIYCDECITNPVTSDLLPR